MKRIAVIAVLLVICLPCSHTDTTRIGLWPRMVLPRLTGAEWRSCPTEDCGNLLLETNEPCPEIIASHKQALQTIVSRPQCTDEAVAALRQFAPTTAAALSDIAAAYLLRAIRLHREADLLLAYEEAQRAVTASRRSGPALFNRALIEERLGLSEQAVDSWKSFLDVDHSDWSREAREHLAQLQLPPAAEQWRANQALLRDALKDGDRMAVRRLIRDFPAPALDWLETRGMPSPDLLASELSLRLGGDRYPLDFAAGRPALMQQLASRPPLAVLAQLEDEAAKRGDRYVLARIRAARGYEYLTENRYLDSLLEYDAAAETFAPLDDAEQLGSLYRNRSGIYRQMGQHALAWREALRATRYLSRTVETRRLNMILNEAFESARAIGDPRLALLYEEWAIRIIRKQVHANPGNVIAVKALQHNLSIALRGRAFAEVDLGMYADAEADGNEALRLAEGTLKDNSAARELLIRTHEVAGRSRLHVNPNAAAEAFGKALAVPSEQRTLRTGLYLERAEALALAGRHREADFDRESALNELRLEEAATLEQRHRGEGERYWTAYFSRFKDTYAQLIRHFIGAGHWRRAFDLDERSRAYEPLNLILQLPSTPASFRKLVPDGNPMSLNAVQAALPAGTFLIQYRVLSDATYAWILSHDAVVSLTLPADRDDVTRWSETLLFAGQARDEIAFTRGLNAPFDALLAKPLEVIRSMPGGATAERLVIVPDGAMYGLPFGALHDPRTNQYLIEQLPVELAGSATLYVFSLLRDAALARETTVFLVGDPKTSGLARLPAAQTEVEQIRAFYEGAEVRTGAEATVAEFLRHAQNKAVVHVAAHSLVNAEEPWHSQLSLAPSENESGVIDAEELLKRLKLDRTRLVVLSACSSAGGHPVGPEGVAPLVRPLIAAGVPAVMGSLWDVEDATAEALSVSFHRDYSKGSDAAKALQAAQLSLLRNHNPGLRSVLAWAPFQVIGHASSPFGPPPNESNGGTHLGIHRSHSLQRDDGFRPQ